MTRPTAVERFEASINKTETCWLWNRPTSARGYAMLYVDGRPVYGHRFSYELYVGPIPDGLHIDHLCRVRHCVNPEHLEPVTCGENIRRGMAPNAIAVRTDTCKNGHSLADAYERGDGNGRVCRTCSDARSKEWHAAESKRLGRWNRDLTCKHGHPWTDENTRYMPDGSRACRICVRVRNRRSDAKRRAAKGVAA